MSIVRAFRAAQAAPGARHSIRAATIGLALALAVAMALPGCAQPGRNTTPPSAAGSPCNAGIGALVGGVTGALIGRAADRNRGAGTLIGAGVGAGLGSLACLAYNYHTRQTRTAAQVTADYQARSGQALPDSPQVSIYRTQAGRTSASRGESITVTSTIEIVPGRTQPLNDLHEDFAIVDPDGHERTRFTKRPAPAGSTGGAYVATLDFTFPKDIPNGIYQVRSQLFVNGQAAGNGDVSIQLARAGAGSVAARRAVAATPSAG